MCAATQRLLVVFLATCALSASAAEVAVHTERDGDALQIVAVADFAGNQARAWSVLTDYGRMAEFVPSLSSSRILSRDRTSAVVEQSGEARLLFLSFPLQVRLAITERPYDRVESRSIAGNFREMTSTYTLEARKDRVLLRYTGRLVPDFDVPPLIGDWLLARSVEEAFRALVGEIERRHASTSPER